MSPQQSYVRGGLGPLAASVRRDDRDRYLTVLFAPAAARDALIALYAFNHEIAKIREVVREPMLGRIRLEWWRESIAAICAGGPVRHHEVVEPLAAAVRAKRLTRAYLDALIAARELDLEDTPPPDMAALEAYARASSVPLVLLALEALGVRDEAAAKAAEGVGVAYALAGLLRATVFLARQRRSWLPSDLVAARGIEPYRSLFELKWDPALGEVAALVAERARAGLAAARAVRKAVPRTAISALLPGVIARRALDALARERFNLLSPRVARPDPGAGAALLWAALRGRY